MVSTSWHVRCLKGQLGGAGIPKPAAPVAGVLPEFFPTSEQATHVGLKAIPKVLQSSNTLSHDS